jgi:hypothetical protein
VKVNLLLRTVAHRKLEHWKKPEVIVMGIQLGVCRRQGLIPLAYDSSLAVSVY